MSKKVLHDSEYGASVVKFGDVECVKIPIRDGQSILYTCFIDQPRQGIGEEWCPSSNNVDKFDIDHTNKTFGDRYDHDSIFVAVNFKNIVAGIMRYTFSENWYNLPPGVGLTSDPQQPSPPSFASNKDALFCHVDHIAVLPTFLGQASKEERADVTNAFCKLFGFCFDEGHATYVTLTACRRYYETRTRFYPGVRMKWSGSSFYYIDCPDEILILARKLNTAGQTEEI